jgi:hypothetical protein
MIDTSNCTELHYRNKNSYCLKQKLLLKRNIFSIADGFLPLVLIFISLISNAQDTTFYIGNSAVVGLGVNQGNYAVWPYKGADWALVPEQKNFIAEYQLNAGKLLKPLSQSYSFLFESGFKVGYQSGKISNSSDQANYSETSIGLPVAIGVVKKTKQKLLKHTIGFSVYGSVLEEIKTSSGNDKTWSFFSQPRGMVFLNTQLLFRSKKSGRYRGLGLEFSKDIGFKYKATAIPFVVENMRLGISLSPFCDFF